MIKSKELQIFITSFLIFFFSWIIVAKLDINNLSIQSEDTVPTIFLPVTIIKERTLYLDSYYDMMVQRYPQPDDKDYKLGNTPFYLRKIDGHYLSAFPVVTSMLAMPIYAVAFLFVKVVTWDFLIVVSHSTAALIVSASGVLLYKLLKQNFATEKTSYLVSWIYLLGTLNYSLVSQALWQHGSAQFFTLLSLYSFYKNKNLNLFLAGLFSALAFLTRPTTLVLLPLYFVLLYFNVAGNRHPFESQKFVSLLKKYSVIISGWVPVLLLFVWYNSQYYKSIFNQGYADQAVSSWQSRFPEGFLGLWISPSKGILVYSPIFIFSLVSVWLLLKKKLEHSASANRVSRKEYLLIFFVVIVHTLVLGKWKHWYGGWSFGYRMASEILPYLAILLVPFVESVYFSRYRSFFYLAFFVSVASQLHGIAFFDGVWHAAYDRGFVDTQWLWSLENSELAFNIRRILVKLGLIARACPKCLPG